MYLPFVPDINNSSYISPLDLQHYCYGEYQTYHEMERALIGISNLYQLNIQNFYLPWTDTEQHLMKGIPLDTWKYILLSSDLNNDYPIGSRLLFFLSVTISR